MKKVKISIVCFSGLLVIFPFSFMLEGFFHEGDEVYGYITSVLLGTVLWNTVWLMLGVSLLSLILGVGSAALVSFFDFPWVKFFSWAFLCPLAFPSYVLAFIYIGLFDFTGPVQTWFREHIDPNTASWFPPIRSTGGVMVIFSLCLYPYIYLLSQQAFSTLSSRFTQASQVLGYRFSQTFRKLILPLSAPWVGSGLLLVLMETLADYGGVSAFNYDTITTTIYKSWFGLGSIEAAMALSTWLMLPALGLMGVSRCLKGKKRFDSIEPMMAFQKIRLSKPMALLAWGVCALMFFFVFALPLFQLMYWSLSQFNSDHVMLNVDDVIHSVLQSLIVSGLIVALAFLISASLRYPKAWDRWFVSISLLGYGIPGTIVAVMVFKSFTFLDHVLWLPYLAPLLNQEGVLLSSTLMALVAGLVCRYFSVGFSSVDSQMEHIHPDLKAASHVLGANARRTMLSVYAPLTQKACGIAFVMVFVDIMKEMPITLMTRPMGWNTLSVRVYEFTAEGDWERAAWPALILVAVGMLPLAVIHGFNKSR